MKRFLISLSLCSTYLLSLTSLSATATPPRSPDRTVNCEILVVGGGLAGVATAYEGLLAGRTVCLTEITDWLGGQLTSQGTSALDEKGTQRELMFFPRGYLELRQRIKNYYGTLNPGKCWVSEVCFIPRDGAKILYSMLQDAAKRGKGKLEWFPATVVKELEFNSSGTLIQGVLAIQHQPAPGTSPLNTEPLSQTIEDSYRYENSPRFNKTIIRFIPSTTKQNSALAQSPAPKWYVIDATETGELLALADVPYTLGINERSFHEPSSSRAAGDDHCTQGFTYTFAMEHTQAPQPHTMPPFYPQYAPYYSYEAPRLASFPLVFTYRRIWDPHPGKPDKFHGIEFTTPTPGDISMQNWTWGNDYRPGTVVDNLIYTRDQLIASGQLAPGGWMGGLRVASLYHAEQLAQGYFYWLVAGTTDSQLGPGVKQPEPNNRYLTGLDSPMGTVYGLSKYPYIREGRHLIGRPSWGRPQGFGVWEIDISRKNYLEDYYQQALSANAYFNLRASLAGLYTTGVIAGTIPLSEVKLRTRATIYPDSVGIGFYPIDFHPCMAMTPPELPGNFDYPGERRGGAQTYPFQIPLRAMIPQRINNMLVAGKSIATSHIAGAAYRVHSFEWSSGAAAGTTAAFALEKAIAPYQLVENLPNPEPELEDLQQLLKQNGNPIAFPDTSIFNNSWENWK